MDNKAFAMCNGSGLDSGVGNPSIAPTADAAQAGMDGIAHMAVMACFAKASGEVKHRQGHRERFLNDF